MRPAEVLRVLAETLSVPQTLGRCPGLDRAGLRRLLIEAADRASRQGDAPPSVRKAAKPPAEPQEEVDSITPPDAGARLSLYTDGGSRGNPGPAGAGAVARDQSGKIVGRWHRFLGRMTNNQAEYEALLLGLEQVAAFGPSFVDLRLDSELLVKQVLGQYRVKNPGLAPLHARVMQRLRRLPAYDIRHVPRRENAEADRLANLAMDEGARA